jgi:hypothetical protein
MKVCFFAALVAVLLLMLVGCAPDGSSSIDPSVVNTRYQLSIDGRQVDLGQPTGTKLVTKNGTKISIGAEQNPGMGNYIQGSSIAINDPLVVGTFDCNAPTSQVQLTPGDFFGFKPTITDCSVVLQYVSEDRVVGTFTAVAHSDQGSDAKVEGEFDVPIKELKL